MTAKPRTAEKAVEDKPAVDEKPAKKPGECVVDAPFHVGGAVNGKVCSYHAVSHRPDGTPR